MGIVTGKDATIYIASGGTIGSESYRNHSWYAISDFGITFTRGTVDQPLVGETGNYSVLGALAVDGTYTNCRFGTALGADDIYGIANGKFIRVSGNVAGASSFRWYFASCQVTGFDVKMGDADTITTASISFVIMNPHTVVYDSVRKVISDAI